MSNFNLFGCFENEVYGLDHHENEYYCTPPVTSESGCALPEFVSGYCEQNFQVYPVISAVQGGTTYFYYPHVIYIPVLYYVPIYYTSQVLTVFEDLCVPEDNLSESDGIKYACNGRPEEYGPFNDVYNSFQETLSKGMTTVQLSYHEYPKKLNGASPDDKNESVVFDEKLDKETVSHGSHVNESTAVNQSDQRVYSIDMYPYEEEVDEKVIKKISLLDIDEIKEEDDKYEDGKMFLYNQVLKGYIVNKNQLEELDWECHFLEDILEEEEPESELSEMDFDENFVEDLINIRLKDDTKKNDLPDEEKQPPFVPTSLPDELHVTSSMVTEEANQPFKVLSEIGMDKSIDFRPNKSELSSTEEFVDGGSMIRVGDKESRNTPDRYRYFCLQESRKKRFKPIRKFFARIWRYVKKPT